jgi:hypothetical protein
MANGAMFATYYRNYLIYFYFLLQWRKSRTKQQLNLEFPPPFNACAINYNDPPIYRDGGSWQFSPKPFVAILFRAPSGHDSYKKPLEVIQRPINSYMGWFVPPTIAPELLRFGWHNKAE